MLIYFLIVYLACLTIHTGNAKSNDLLPICEPEFVRCICGSVEDKLPHLTTTLKSCFNNVTKSCQACPGKNITCFCEKFANCKSCGEGLDRCLTCPHKKYGQWCDKDCPCVNDGACDQNGRCICLHGFSGERCESLVLTDPFDVNYEEEISETSYTTTENSKQQRRKVRQTGEQSTGCRMLVSPENGIAQIDTDQPQPGSVVKYICKEGFSIIGSRSRQCLSSGLWSGETPSCERLCPFPVTTPYLNVKINPNRVGPPFYDSYGNEILSELEFNCSQGFVLSGSRIIRCAAGVWDHDIPTCQIQLLCRDPGELTYGSRDVIGLNSGNMYRLGSQIIYKCDQNYTLVGENSSTCTPNGSWSSPVPVCLPNVSFHCNFNCKSQTGEQINFQKQQFTCHVPSQTNDFVLQPDL